MVGRSEFSQDGEAPVSRSQLGHAPIISETSMRTRDALRHLIKILPVPEAPPRYASRGAAIGVTLLDSALSLDHVSRLDESLRVVDRAHLSRQVRLHISTDRLTPEQYKAGLAYTEMQGPTVPGRDAGEQTRRLVWLPVTRLNRAVVAPVNLLDEDGRQTPRATQAEILPLLNAALYRLFGLVLGASPDASDENSELYKLLHGANQARWLFKLAIRTLIYDNVDTSWRYLDSPLEKTVEQPRKLALSVLDRYLSRDPEPYLELLAHASEEYLVLAGLDATKSEHFLQYTAPILPASGGSPVRSAMRRLGRTFCPSGREFVIQYATPLPRNIDSYHVTVEADEQVKVREAFLTTDHAAPAVFRLRSDMAELCRLADEGVAPGNSKFYEYELQDAFGKLASLALYRSGDLASYENYLHRVGARKPSTSARPSQGSPRAPSASRHSKIRHLLNLAVRFNRGELTQLVGNPEADSTHLTRLNEIVEGYQLELDLVPEDDPREHAAHIYWRPRSPLPGVLGVPHPSTATIAVVFADDPPSMAASVMRATAALCLLTLSLGTLLFDGLDWMRWYRTPALATETLQSDAVIAVLLLAPVLLLNRLDLPKSNTLLGQLRVLPRVIAIAAVSVTGGVGVAIAASGQTRLLQVAFLASLGVLTLLAMTLAMEMTGAFLKSRRSRATVCGAPRWLYDARSCKKSRRRPDAEFAVTGTL